MMRKILLLAALIILSAIPAAAQNSTYGAITASASSCTGNANSESCVRLQLPANQATVSVTVLGTFSATLAVERSANNGGTWVSAGGNITSPVTTTYAVAGYTDFRVRASAYTSGSANITITSSTAAAGSITSGTGVPSGSCGAEDLYVRTGTGDLYSCLAGVWSLASGSGVPTTRTITATTPLLIDGAASADLSANRTISIISGTLASWNAKIDPTPSALQTIQPSADVTGLRVKCFNGANTQPVFSLVDKVDANLFSMTCAGVGTFGVGGDPILALPATRGNVPYVNATPAWSVLALGPATAGKYLKSNGTDVVISTGSASGTGACSAGQAVGTLNADAAPTCIAASGIPLQITKRWSQAIVNGNASGTTWSNSIGQAYTTTGTGLLLAAVGGGALPLIQFSTAASTNADAGTRGDNGNLDTVRNPYFASPVKVTSQAAGVLRAWWGLTNNTLINQNASASPTGMYAMFRYDTSASDTNYMCTTNNSSTFSATSSGIAADAAQHTFEIQITQGTNVVFKIDGATVCTKTGASLPATNNLLNESISIRTLENVAKTIASASIYSEQNP